MNFQKLIEFRFHRDVVLIHLIREKKINTNQALTTPANQAVVLSSSHAANLLTCYTQQLRELFPNSEYLFPTEDGQRYLPVKFQQNIRKLLVMIEQKKITSNPLKMTDEQVRAIEALKFNYQRPLYQLIISAALMGYMALRPSEVAKLRKEDININEKIMNLRDTKSQEDQQVYIHPDLIIPLKNYLSYLKDDEPLFIRQSSNKQWVRKDAYLGTGKISTYLGISRIYPRRLRSTVATQMLRRNIPINEVSAILRHKDVATTLRHYSVLIDLNLTWYALEAFDPTSPVPPLKSRVANV